MASSLRYIEYFEDKDTKGDVSTRHLDRSKDYTLVAARMPMKTMSKSLLVGMPLTF